MFEGLECAGHFLKLPYRGLFLMRQYPILHVQRAALALVFFREGYVVADVNVDAVVIDRVQDFPMVGLRLGGNIVVRLFQAAVGNAYQVLRHGHTGLHSAIRFISAMIFVGPPDTRPDTLARGDDKMLAEIVSPPRYATNPGRILTHNRNPFVKYFDLVLDTFRKFLVEHYPINISFTFELELRVAVRDFCD